MSSNHDPSPPSVSEESETYFAGGDASRTTWRIWSVGAVFLAANLWCFTGSSAARLFVHGPWFFVYMLKTTIEIIACNFSAFYLLVAFFYRQPHASVQPSFSSRINTETIVVYLCSDDLNTSALENIVRFCWGSKVGLVIHDDSRSYTSRQSVDAFVSQLRLKYDAAIQVLRRPIKSGGKPGAVNNVVAHLPEGIQYLLLCDSDSYILSPGILEDATPLLADGRVAVVQFRSIGYTYAEECLGYCILAESIDFYDAFVTFMDRFGWSPFLGHNALLRVSAFKEVGGFTPGQLADDIDFSIKVRLLGYKIRYLRSGVCGERHPASYGSLRRRTAKWAYGCTQILMRWSRKITRSARLTLYEKLTFFLTVGYYHFQALLLIYLAIFYLLLPFDSTNAVAASSLLRSAGLILLITYLPSISFFLRSKRIANWPSAATCWGFTYGSQDMVIGSAIIRCLFGRQMAWIPTNGVQEKSQPQTFALEQILAFLILAIAILKRPTLLVLPTTVLFAGKFLITPYLDRLFFNGSPTRSRGIGSVGEKTGRIQA